MASLARLSLSGLFLCLVVSTLIEARSSRVRRDATCAAGGHQLCNMTCKMRGYKEGECSWNTETGAYNCDCVRERRGIRCNLGGPNTCHYSCVALGYNSGQCEGEELKCRCGGGNNRWGEWLDNIRGRL